MNDRVFSLLDSCQGVKAVIAESFERIHRSNLVGMGIIPLEFVPEENAESLGLTGKESYTIDLPEEFCTGQIVDVKVSDGVCVPPSLSPSLPPSLSPSLPLSPSLSLPMGLVVALDGWGERVRVRVGGPLV